MALDADSVIKSPYPLVCMSVCLSVCALQNTQVPGVMVKGNIPYIGQ